MGVTAVMDLSLGEWAALVSQWNKAHAKTPAPPSAEEFERAVLAARGLH